MARKVRYQRDKTLTPKLSPRGPLEKAGIGLWIVMALLLLALGWLAWRALFQQRERDPVESALIAFDGADGFTVFATRFEVGIDAGGGGEATAVPASARYAIDLAALDREDFAWDAAGGVLTVTLPPLRIDPPTVDLDTARALSSGERQEIERRALATARSAEFVTLARTAARDTIRQNLALPLHMSGYPGAMVSVRFANEG